ncbi:uncharacterized protein LOC126381958 isoform X3 [Pectinophora gossypiella]|uniref:uncharacterized protein LOC126381958 isoform X3 n=1 Tax=Pectinophora gossypiella TaxID=13191 RepID=UPI00214E94DB|nr:uncharacterized protein LOC126381958 isoform X3 [Pectinophora gossypiella]
MAAQTKNSVETILNFETTDDNLSDWSVVWSTNQIPGMDTATGGGSTRRRKTGRRRLRRTALTLGSMLAMHCRMGSVALTCGMFVFLMMLIPCIGVLANPLRHFEVYLGQWSLSGPGRAFRIIPMLDGVGLAICIHALTRAIVSVGIAGLSALYVMHSVSDNTLPFTHCRTHDLTKYNPVKHYIDVKLFETENADISLESLIDDGEMDTDIPTTVGMQDFAWRRAHNESFYRYSNLTMRSDPRRFIYLCKERYTGYPPIFRTPPYNFFYVELIHYRADHNFFKINLPLLISMACCWAAIWIGIISEKFRYGRMIWNNMYPWFGYVPWLWAALLLFIGIRNFLLKPKSFRNVVQIGGDKEILYGITEAFIMGAYVHAAGLGSEIIHGKGLNFYASGHIDPQLNSDNLWHTALLFLLVCLLSGGANICALSDYMQMKGINKVDESTLWILPMYSKCTASGDFSHFLFVEQLVVSAVIVCCMCFSVLFASNAGLGFLESLDSILAGIVAMFICAFEMFGIMYVYRSYDFVSDLNIATEENACSTRLAIQWQIIPFVCMLMLVIKAVQLSMCEIPNQFFAYTLPVLLCAVLSLPLRAIHNAYVFLRPPARHA